MPQLDLTPDQQTDAARLREHPATALAADIAGLAELLATTTDRDLFGPTEFQVRDLVHAIGAKALQVTADLRKKRATTGPAEDARPAGARPNSTAGSQSGS